MEEETVERLQNIELVLSPEVLDVAIQVVQVDAIKDIIQMVVFALVGLLAWRMFKKHYPMVDWDKYGLDWDVWASVFSFCWIVIAAIVVVASVTDVWMYMAFINPKLAAVNYLIENLSKVAE